MDVRLPELPRLSQLAANGDVPALQEWATNYARAAVELNRPVDLAVIVEGLRLADQFFDGQDNTWEWDNGEAFPASKVRAALRAALGAEHG